MSCRIAAVIFCLLGGSRTLASEPEPAEVATLEPAELDNRGLHFGPSASGELGAVTSGDVMVGGMVAVVANHRWRRIDLRGSLGFMPMGGGGGPGVGGAAELEIFWRLSPLYKVGVGARAGVHVPTQCRNCTGPAPLVPTALVGLKTQPFVMALDPSRTTELGFFLSLNYLSAESALLSNGSRLVTGGTIFATTGVQLTFLVF